MNVTARFPRIPAPRLALAALISLAAIAPASPGRALQWAPQDGPFGGTVIALDDVSSGAVFAMRNDAVFRTTDGGAQWVDVSSSASAFTFLALDATESGAIWAGTSTRGVAWSLNGGLTWTNDQITNDPHSGLGATIVAIGVDPAGRIFAGGFRSVNQGASFTQMSIGGWAFAFDEAGEAIAGTSDGVWRSADGGATWTPANTGIEGKRVNALALDGPAGIWAGTLDGEVARSTDSGVTWAIGANGLPGTYVTALEVVPGGALAATGGGGLFRSTDGGATWLPAGAEPGDVHDLHLGSGGALWLGTTGRGVFVSSDGAATAVPASAASMYAPGLSDLAPDVAGPLYLSSTQSGVFRSTDGGGTWTPASSGLPSLFVVDLTTGDANHVWGASWEGVVASTDGGGSWSSAGFADRKSSLIVRRPAGALITAVEGDSFQPEIQRSTDAGGSWTEVWTSPAAFQLDSSTEPGDGSVLLGGASFFGGLLVRSTDDGTTWQESALGTAGIEALTSGPTGRVWAAASDNVVHRSTDHGVTWTALPPGGWPSGTFGSLDALAYGLDGLFVAGSGQVFRSTDLGDTWSALNDGFPAGTFATRLVATPSGLFAGTGASGVFRLTGTTSVPGTAPRVATIAVAPNPFRSATRVRWELPRPAVVRVLVHDVHGRLVADLSPGAQPAGEGAVTWNGRGRGGVPVAPGAYFLRWEADGRAGGAKVLRLR